MIELCKVLLAPLFVAVLSGIVIYLIQAIKLRVAIISGLISEINLNLAQSLSLKTYLSQDNHEWYIPGIVLDEPPIFTPNKDLIFETYLPYFYLLTKKEIQKVTLFYVKANSCQSSMIIIFHRIQQQSNSGKPLSETQVALNKLRVKKMLNSFESFCQVTNGKIIRLNDLPSVYIEPDNREIDHQMNEVKRRGIRKV